MRGQRRYRGETALAGGRRPDFVIIGAQKSGSTHLVETLRRHPKIYMPRGETKHFKDPEYRSAPPGALEAALGPVPPNVQLVGIKCPEYLADKQVPARLKQDLGDPRLIAVLRDPVSRAVSAYFWHVLWGALPVVDVEEGMRRVLSGEWCDRYPASREVLEFGRYGQHLGRYLMAFDKSRLLVLVDEDLRTSQTAAFQTCLNFLGVQDQAVPGGRKPSNEGVYDARRLRWLRRRNRLVFAWDTERQMSVMRRPTRPYDAVANGVIVAADRFVLRHVWQNKQPALSAELHNALKRHFREDVAETEELLGRELKTWH